MNRLEKAAGHTRIAAAPVVEQQKYRKVVFLSSTDTCRGPMAAEILRHQSLEQEYVIESRGLVVLFPEPANQKAEAILKSGQMTLEGHMSSPLTQTDIQDDVLIFTMDEAEKQKVLAQYENAVNVYTLNEFVDDSTEIPDPYGQPLTAYGECYEILIGLINKLTGKLNSFTEGEQ